MRPLPKDTRPLLLPMLVRTPRLDALMRTPGATLKLTRLAMGPPPPRMMPGFGQPSPLDARPSPAWSSTEHRRALVAAATISLSLRVGSLAGSARAVRPAIPRRRTGRRGLTEAEPLRFAGEVAHGTSRGVVQPSRRDTRRGWGASQEGQGAPSALEARVHSDEDRRRVPRLAEVARSVPITCCGNFHNLVQSTGTPGAAAPTCSSPTRPGPFAPAVLHGPAVARLGNTDWDIQLNQKA